MISVRLIFITCLTPPGERRRSAFPRPERAPGTSPGHPRGVTGVVSQCEENGRGGVQPAVPAAAGDGDRRVVRAVHQTQRLQEHLPRGTHTRDAVRGDLRDVRGRRDHGVRGRGRHRKRLQHGAGLRAHHSVHMGVHPLLRRIQRTGRSH